MSRCCAFFVFIYVVCCFVFCACFFVNHDVFILVLCHFPKMLLFPIFSCRFLSPPKFFNNDYLFTPILCSFGMLLDPFLHMFDHFLLQICVPLYNFSIFLLFSHFSPAFPLLFSADFWVNLMHIFSWSGNFFAWNSVSFLHFLCEFQDPLLKPKFQTPLGNGLRRFW